MAVTEPQTRPLPAQEGRWRGGAFGIVLEGEGPVPGLPEAHAHSERVVRWRHVAPSVVDGAWPVDVGEVLVERRYPDGRLFMRVDRHDGVGFRIWAPRHGRHLVSDDGRVLESALPRRRSDGWWRLFFAQPLPLAAALQGLEVFHASAVALNGHVAAFIGPSGAGKTSVAAHLVGLGAEFFTDDVLAVEHADGRVLAHPGAARTSIADHELAALDAPARMSLGPVVGRSDKLHIATASPRDPLPLGLLYFLRRRREGRGPTFRPLPDGARSLLSGGFLPYLTSPARLLNHLDVCAAVAASVRTFAVDIPASCAAADVAAATREHAEGVLG